MATKKKIEHVVDTTDIQNDPNLVVGAEEIIADPSGASIPNIDVLKVIVTQYDYLTDIWVNDAGEWLFCERPGFVSYTRDEILNG
jgi:uncharacterized protein YhfF